MSEIQENNKVFTTMGASNHSKDDREQNDYYATDPKAIDFLLQDCPIKFLTEVPILEPCCGGGHLAKRLQDLGYFVQAQDLFDHGYGFIGHDFLYSFDKWQGNIITNPPYKYAKEFVEKALDVVSDGNIVAMFLKLSFLEGKGRKKMFLRNPPRFLLVSASRMLCGKNGSFDYAQGSAVGYGWYVWVKGYTGRPEILWGN